MICSWVNKVFDLSGKKIIITGSSKGLGSVCANSLANNGAELVLLARTEEKLEKVRRACKNPDKHLSIAVDLTDMNELSKAVKKSKEFLGSVDVVLHVAGGGLGFREDLLSAEKLNKLFTLNVIVAAEINKLVFPDMKKKGKGNLVHVCSIASNEATGSVGYNTVKAALAGYVRSLGRAIADSGVIVTGILPGGFYAPENSWTRLKENKPEIVKKWIEERLPRKFLADAEELIPMIHFLCSDDVSMMSGCLVPVDAGEGKSYFV